MTVESTEIWNLEEEEKQKNREVKSRGQCNKNRSRVFYVWTYYRVSCNQVYFRSCCIVLIDDANGKFGRSTLLYIGGQKGNLILMGLIFPYMGYTSIFIHMLLVIHMKIT